MKRVILISIILAGLFFLFGPEVIPENFQPENILALAQNSDVIIVFNSGGWGNTPPEKAKDFSPIIEGMQKNLKELGYNSMVIPYTRTKENLLGKISGAKEFFSSFPNLSEDLAERIEILNDLLPDKKIIMAGLSSGGDFINETYKKLSQDVKNSVYAITIGAPFWSNASPSGNVLLLNNNGRDALTEGKVENLLPALFKAPLKWIFSKINGQKLSLSQAFYASGHDYQWDSSEVGSQIESFLETKIH